MILFCFIRFYWKA
jgi:hypothetical protein